MAQRGDRSIRAGPFETTPYNPTDARARPSTGIDSVSRVAIVATGELTDVVDGHQRIVGVVIQRAFVRHVYVP